MKITAITSGFNEPSSRFRVRQYLPDLKKKGIFIKEYWCSPPTSYKLPGALGAIRQRYILPLSGSVEIAKLVSLLPTFIDSYKSDLIWMNRPSHNLIHLEKYFNKPVLFDIDDALWINDTHNIKQIAKNVVGIIAGNSFIANWFNKYNNNIFIIPTAIDTYRFIQNYSVSKYDKFVIGWTGSADGLKFVYEVEKQLSYFINNTPNAYFKIICDKKPFFRTIAPEKIIYIPWNPLTENTELQNVSVGIMPLPDNEWSRGKCSFKMLQYMATSIPVVVSDVGMNSEILAKSDVGFGIKSIEEWPDALKALWEDQSLREKMGANGRALIEKEYSVTVIADQLSSIFKK